MPITDLHLAGLTSDSRAVKPGYLFAALPGTKVDGREYIDQAIASGATAILAPAGTPERSGVTFITDDNPRRKFAAFCAEFYGAQPERIVAITGTNGKTSTVYFTAQIWKELGLKADYLGTLNLPLTTPDPVALHAKLAELATQGVTHLAMEASSHGLHQYRLDGVKIQAAGFTNLTHDHLDYHTDMDDYFAAKLRLFSELLPASGTAVLNADSPYEQKIRETCRQRGIEILDYGMSAHKIQLLSAVPDSHGQKLKLNINSKNYDVTLSLVGLFQVENILAALGFVMSENKYSVEELINILPRLTGVPGRLQGVSGHPKGAAVYVDYAHTPDALVNVLKSLRPHTKKRLICLFGCGGDRDKTKRPLMGLAVNEHADLAILTDDNPRSEDPAAIRADVLKAVPDILEIGDRREAIETAMAIAEAGDVVVITGKGHEQGQKIGDQVFPFDDVEEVRKAIEEL